MDRNITSKDGPKAHGENSSIRHKVRVTVLDKKLYPELQEQYCADKQAGACPVCHVRDVYEFLRDDEHDHFWHGGLGTLVQTSADDPGKVAGGPKMPHCSEAWDAISRYIYTGPQGGSIMRG